MEKLIYFKKYLMSKTNIVTIWGGNGQSNLLDALFTYYKKPIAISSIVSMSDDGRTTGELMRKFQDELGLHLPPPGDLRRCLFMMSSSSKRDEFQQYLETVIERDFNISQLTLWDYFRLVWADNDFKEHLSWFKEDEDSFLDFKLPLSSTIKGHKVGNILMANLYYNLENDYNAMLDRMHKILEVQGNIIPVTTKKATIKAILSNGEIIETQDRIGDHAAYSSWIADLELMEDSKHAYQHKDVFKAIKKADYVIISPGDLFTSTISNFVIWGVKEVIKTTEAKLIYIGNNMNKWWESRWETQWLTALDFINKIERFLGRRIDIFIANNQRPNISATEMQKLKAHISVKGGDYLFLSDGERSELERRKIQVYEADLLDKVSFYKHDKKALAELLEQITW